jgi:glycerol-3-phosphate acyltransferase PlsX
MITISFDAMGGDYAPKEIVRGAVLSAKTLGIKALIVGKVEAITEILKEIKEPFADNQGLKTNFEIISAPDNIDMDELNPARAVKAHPQSSIVVANQLVADGKADAVIAAGHSGAATAASLFILRRIQGFERPSIATLIPTHKSKMLLIDAGSNIEANAEQMLQMAVLGQVLAKSLLPQCKDRTPRVGLLNIGEEPGKGNTLYKATFDLLKNDRRINFVGNVEGKNIIDDLCDIAVCDGFTGNIHLKALEGGLKMMSEAFKREFKQGLLANIAGLCFKLSGGIGRIKGHFDPAEYGGALLGGLNYVSLISHGSSSAEAIKNAAKHAKLIVETKVVDKIKLELSQ